MNKIDEFKKILKKEIKKAKKRVSETKTAANEIATAARWSWSQSGDAEHSRGQAEIAKENLQRLEDLFKEISESTQPVFVLLKTEEGEKEYFLLKNTAYIKGINILSKESPFGKNILKSKKGDKIVFKGKSFEILKIE